MSVIVLLSDRSTAQALPALEDLRPDLKHVPLALSSIGHALELQPDVLLVDAGENPGQAWSVLTALKERDPRARTIVIVERPDLGRYPWHELADEFVYPGAPVGVQLLRFLLAHPCGLVRNMFFIVVGRPERFDFGKLLFIGWSGNGRSMRPDRSPVKKQRPRRFIDERDRLPGQHVR